MSLTPLSPRFASVNLALTRLEHLPGLSQDEPADLSRAWEFARAVPDELPAAGAHPAVHWGTLLALAQIVYAEYQGLERAAQGSELDALRIAVALVEAGLERDSGIREEHKGDWALLALIGHGMLGEQQSGAFRSSYLPRLQERPASLTAAALSSFDWHAAASPSAGLLGEPYKSLVHQAILVAYDSPEAQPGLLDPHDFDGLYAQCVRAALVDSLTLEVCNLSYARQSLYQLLAAYARRHA
jgi:hypothetical protein